MKFSDIPGHEDVKRRLRSMVVSDKIPHALLFEGIEGIGKLAMARAFSTIRICFTFFPSIKKEASKLLFAMSTCRNGINFWDMAFIPLSPIGSTL